MPARNVQFGLDRWLPATDNSYVRFNSDGTINTAMEETPKAFMDEMHYRRNDGTGGYAEGRKLRRTARLTPTIIRMWEIQDGINFRTMHPVDRDRYLRAKLNDPDWNKLRICSGRL